MLLQVKTTNLIIKRASILFGVWFVAVLALLPISARAQCSTKWLASGHEAVSIMQRGQKYGMHLSLEQKGRVITGTASHQTTNGVNKGTVDGTLDRDSFRAQIFWTNGQTGVYIGTVLPSGRLDGEGYEKASPNIRVTWHSSGVLKCAPRPFISPTLNKFPGNAKPATQKPAPPPTPPFIIAGQAIIPTPTHPFGIVYLGWDGGPDHPNVEVFVSMDNGAEIPAFSMDQPQQSLVWKQPKIAAIPLQLQRYHHYKFVLKAAGKTLSTTAAFYVP